MEGWKCFHHSWIRHLFFNCMDWYVFPLFGCSSFEPEFCVWHLLVVGQGTNRNISIPSINHKCISLICNTVQNYLGYDLFVPCFKFRWTTNIVLACSVCSNICNNETMLNLPYFLPVPRNYSTRMAVVHYSPDSSAAISMPLSCSWVYWDVSVSVKFNVVKESFFLRNSAST